MKKTNKMTYTELVNSVRDQFVKGLEKDGLHWLANWKPKFRSENGKSKANYRGVNHLRLSFDGYADTRYYTFKQIEDMGMRLLKSQHGQQITKFIPHWDYKNHKSLTEEEYEALTDEQKKTVIPTHKFFYVFNAEQIEGMELQEQAKSQVDTRLIDRIANAMNVKVIYGSKYRQPCYVPSEDKVYMPSKALFKNDKGLYGTALHELAHASGHKSRLNRDNFGLFGTANYAFEELVAEMSSALICSYLGIENTVDDNHKAYVKSWIKKCKDEPKALIDAFKLAENVLDYVIECAELETNEVEVTATAKAKAKTTKAKKTVKTAKKIQTVKTSKKSESKKEKSELEKIQEKATKINAKPRNKDVISTKKEKEKLEIKTTQFTIKNTVPITMRNEWTQGEIINMIKFELVDKLGKVKRSIQMPMAQYVNRSKALDSWMKKKWGIE